MFLAAKFTKFNIIFYFIQQLMFLPDFCMCAILDFETKEFINGKVFRAAVLHYPPAISIKKEANGTFSYDGSSIEILNCFARVYNVTLEYVHLSLAEVAKHSIGIAQRNIILNDEADISALGFAPSLNYSLIDLSVPVLIQPYRLIVPWPDEESRLLAPIRPFQPAVWLCLGATLAVVAPTLSFLSGMYKKLTKNTGSSQSVIQAEDVAQNTLFMLSHLTNHGYHVRLNSRARTIVIVIWLLMTIVLANGYAGVLFSFLSVPKLEPIVNSLEELAESKTVQLVTLEKTTWALQLMDSLSGTQKLIADSLRKNPSNLIIIEEAEKKLMSGKYAFGYYDMFNYGIIDSTYKKSGNKCRLTPAREPISFFTPVSFGLTKFGPYTEAFNHNVQVQHEAGLIDRFIKTRIPRIDKCIITNHDVSAKQKGLTLVDMSSAFVILGFGLSLALLVFLWELAYTRIKDRYFKN